LFSQQAGKKLVPCKYKIISNDSKLVVGIAVNSKMATFAPEELYVMILQEMKSAAETFLGEDVDRAIITVPAYFNND